MKSFILFDDSRNDLLPLTFTRPVAEIRIGILTIREKWEYYLNSSVSFHTEPYLSVKYPKTIQANNIFINGSILPNNKLVAAIEKLKPGESLIKANIIIGARFNQKEAEAFTNNISKALKIVQYHDDLLKISNTWEIFQFNDIAIQDDFQVLTKGKKTQPISKTNNIVCAENIFIEEGAKVECAVLNASAGPIYIGKDAEVMEGCLVRGPFALCDHSTLKMGAKIYGATTIGPNSKIGGEVNNCVVFGNSNKAHDGFLGNSVVAEWCNLGADTNNSNLKNNYAEVKLWNHTKEKFIPTGLQFCGLIIGDHSKCGINTMFNTGTVVGVSANIFGAGFPRNFIPSFSWGGPQGMSVYQLDKAFDTIEKVYQRRKKELNTVEKDILEHVFINTEKYRRS